MNDDAPISRMDLKNLFSYWSVTDAEPDQLRKR